MGGQEGDCKPSSVRRRGVCHNSLCWVCQRSKAWHRGSVHDPAPRLIPSPKAAGVCVCVGGVGVPAVRGDGGSENCRLQHCQCPPPLNVVSPSHWLQGTLMVFFYLAHLCSQLGTLGGRILQLGNFLRHSLTRENYFFQFLSNQR